MIFFWQTAIKTALDTLPNEIIAQIVNYIHPRYCEKLSITSALNQENYFGNSPHQVLAGLDIKVLDVLFSCKTFYNKFPNSTVVTPPNYMTYRSYLAENVEIFDITKENKRILLKNLAFLFFGLDETKIVCDTKTINPPFYEPFAFALTTKHYGHFIGFHKYLITKNENLPCIDSEMRFFKDVALLHERLSKSNVPIEISIFMTHYFNDKNDLNFKDKKPFEKILETNDDNQKAFVSFLKTNKSKINDFNLKSLFSLDYDWMESKDIDINKDIVMNIVNFFL